ncbi:MAG TPA: BTAD domain-containing putative transcriptional regulator [Longimicrobium sp.]|nr:BTAD domain-containing putative transcriptional regulator [Longimicrobium sp.]
MLLGPAGPLTGRAAYRRRIALLAILAVARRRPVGRERLIGLLWPEHPADAARHTLSESLYVLRKEMGDGAFVAAGDDLALSPEVVATDVGAFEEALEEGRLEDAVAAYGGPFLDGFYVSDAQEFGHWVDGERDRLARAYAQALETLAERAEAEGRALDAAEWWRRLAAHDPYSSRVALRLAAALEGAGERAAAIRALAGHAGRVRADLELEPEPEVAALEQRLRSVPPAPPPAPSPAPVATAPAEAASPAILPGQGPAAPARTLPAPPPPARAWPAGRGPAAGVALLVLFLAVAALVPSLASRPAGDEPARYDPRRIAVLYFDDQSPDGDLGYLAAGLTGELIDQLSGVPALEVVSRNGVKAYRDGEMGFDSLVARLGVGSVVDGSVQRYGDSVRVTVRLVDTNRGRQLESRTVIRPVGDLFALERTVGQEVSGFLRRRLGREVRFAEAAAETRSAHALALRFRGEAAHDEAWRMARRGHPLDQASARRLFARADSFLAAAEAADPGWARPALLRGALSLDRASLASGGERARLHAMAAASASRALSLDPRDPAALALRGRVRWRQALEAGRAAPDSARLAAAEADLRAAVEADSSLAPAWAALSQVLRVRGKLAESDLAARRALAADAYLEGAHTILSRLYFSAMTQGDHAQARRWCDEGRAHFPADWRFVECQLTLAREDPSVPPDPDRAWELVAELDRLDPPARAVEEGRLYSPVYRRVSAAAVLARAGAADSARAVLARARVEAAAAADTRVSFLYDEAYVALLLGDRAAARRLLDAYLAERPQLRESVLRDPAFRGLFTR